MFEWLFQKSEHTNTSNIKIHHIFYIISFHNNDGVCICFDLFSAMRYLVQLKGHGMSIFSVFAHFKHTYYTHKMWWEFNVGKLNEWITSVCVFHFSPYIHSDRWLHQQVNKMKVQRFKILFKIYFSASWIMMWSQLAKMTYNPVKIDLYKVCAFRIAYKSEHVVIAVFRCVILPYLFCQTNERRNKLSKIVKRVENE